MLFRWADIFSNFQFCCRRHYFHYFLRFADYCFSYVKKKKKKKKKKIIFRFRRFRFAFAFATLWLSFASFSRYFAVFRLFQIISSFTPFRRHWLPILIFAIIYFHYAIIADSDAAAMPYASAAMPPRCQRSGDSDSGDGVSAIARCYWRAMRAIARWCWWCAAKAARDMLCIFSLIHLADTATLFTPLVRRWYHISAPAGWWCHCHWIRQLFFHYARPLIFVIIDAFISFSLSTLFTPLSWCFRHWLRWYAAVSFHYFAAADALIFTLPPGHFRFIDATLRWRFLRCRIFDV